MSASRWGARVLALLAGLLAALSQPPVSWPIVLAIALPALFLLWHKAEGSGRAFWIGWFAGLGYFAATLHWIAEPFLVQPEIYGWMIPFAVTAMAGGMALFWGAGFWVAHRIGSGGWGAPFALTFAWVGMEWLRGNILSGFPWSLIGYAWVETLAGQIAALVGIYGVTLWTVLIGAMLGHLLLMRGVRRQLGYGAAILVLGIAPVVYAMGGLVAARVIEGKGLAAASADDRLRIGLVQPNIAQRDKWQPALREAHLQDFLDKTRALTDRGADVVIWPEAALPYQFDQAPKLRAMIADALGTDATLLAGGVRFEGSDAFNSLIALGPDGSILDTYDKQHLVPFGEMLPLESVLTRLGIRTMITLPGGFAPGSDRERRVEIAGLPPFVPMICYEAIFPAEIMRRAAGGEWMVQVTNDAWFGNWVGPYQHFAMARMRAIERGLPVARAANTGVSAIIDGYGRVLGSLPLNESGTVLGRLPSRAPTTLYARYEDVPFGAGLLILGLLGWVGRRWHQT